LTNLKTGLIYGANASGKSNFYDALRAIHFLIFSKPDDQKISTVYHPFRLSQETEVAPIVLQYQFLASNTVEYRYEVEYTNNTILKETLHFKPKGQDSLLYERTGTQIKFGDAFPKSKDIIRDYVARPENQERLLLIIAGQLGLEKINEAFQFFSQILFWDQSLFNINDEKTEDFLLALLYRNKSTLWFEYYEKLIMSLDIGIKKIDITEFKNELNEKVQHYLTTKRNRKNRDGTMDSVPFGLFNESAGTHNLLNLAVPVIDALLYGKLIVVDEIDRSLHPQIVEYLIQLFHDPTVNTKNAQLICITHNAQLMNPETMRRDQIWIAEKDEEGASQMFPLSNFSGLKKDAPFGKYYLAGKLGGTPVIDDLDFKQSFAHG
jgi:AAA15 family ATPase/GTPase